MARLQYKRKLLFIALIAFVSLMTISESVYASQSGLVKKANKLFSQENYDDSIEKYTKALEKDPESDIINFNLGTAYYKREHYQKAEEHLQKALLSEEPAVKQKAHYNLGNTFFKRGIELIEKNPQGAIFRLENAVKQYEQAVLQDGEDEDAKFNFQYAQKKIEELKKKQEQEQQQDKNCPNGKESKEDSQENKSDKKDQQQQQNQEKQNQENQNNSQQDQQQSQQQQGQEDSQQAQQQDMSDEEGQEQQEKSEEQSGDEKDKESEQQSANAGEEKDDQQGSQEKQGQQSATGQELTQKEGQMILKNYEQSEEPQGLLMMHKMKGRRDPVIRDW